MLSDKTVFAGNIVEVESDLTAVYIGSDYERIDLSPAALYKALKQFRHVGTMINEDIKATGLDIFD